MYLPLIENIICADLLTLITPFSWPLCSAPLQEERHLLIQTHQEIAQALVVKNFALVRLRQLFAQLDCLFPHLQKKKKRRVTSGEQSSHWSSSSSHSGVTGQWLRSQVGSVSVDISPHASLLGSTNPGFWHYKSTVPWLLCQGAFSILFARTWRTPCVPPKSNT